MAEQWGHLIVKMPRAYPVNSSLFFFLGKLTTEAQDTVFLGFMPHGSTHNLSYYVARISKLCLIY